MTLFPISQQELTTGETLSYRKVGKKGPVLVLLHGNLSSSVHFEKLMEQLKDHVQLLAIDMRGFGHSSYHQSIASLTDLARDVLNLLDLLAIDRCTVLGWSTGGGVALEMAALRPKLIQQLVLLSSVGVKGYVTPKDNPLTALGMFPFMIPASKALTKWNPALQKIEYALKHRREGLIRKILAPLYQNNPISEQEFQVYLDAAYQQRNYSDIFLSLFTFNITLEHNGITLGNGHIEKIQAPVLIIHGDKDPVVSLDTAKLTHKALQPHSQLIVLEAGHSILTDQLDQLTALLKDYLYRPHD
ncbi:alpha/beta fold hydrolase [Streptococcus oriscaviae]|uniref:Alpha/beta hydrolase n=1 Tax=Streptococcus oriscaviae TaxID=2781599 RepID=A0ABX7YM55_9STRE|nr:alpha/beta hydrolase [Streptococcus oriscaviae]QUE54911.1 alpha/beta hydrolase [Streptococcus oriscaviae]